MKQLTILVDMDDTIESLLSAWVSYLNWKHALHVKTEDVKSWNVHDAFPGLTKTEVYAPLYDEKLWLSVKPIPYAADVLYELQKEGHEIYIVTSSNYHTLKAKMENVLFKYFPFIDWNHVIIAHNKQMIRGDILIDDGPHNHVGGSYLKIMMDMPHNRDFDATANGVIRVYSWPEIGRIVREYAKDMG